MQEGAFLVNRQLNLVLIRDIIVLCVCVHNYVAVRGRCGKPPSIRNTTSSVPASERAVSVFIHKSLPAHTLQ